GRGGSPAALRPADPRRAHRRPLAVHPAGWAGRGLEGSRAAAGEPAQARPLRARIVGTRRGPQARRARTLATRPLAARRQGPAGIRAVLRRRGGTAAARMMPDGPASRGPEWTQKARGSKSPSWW